MEWFNLKNNIYACLEIGCAEIRMVICNIKEERLYVLARESIESKGVENETITNVNQVVGSLKKLKANVELSLNQKVEQVLLAIPTVDVVVKDAESTVKLGLTQPINFANIKQLFRNVSDQSQSNVHTTVNIVPRLFKVDKRHVVQNPYGVTGNEVSLVAQKMLAPSTVVSGLINIVELAGFMVADVIIGSVAETLYTLNSPELLKSSSHINIGKTSTIITIVQAGKIISTKRALSIGGQHVTEAIKETFGIDEATAERLKVRFGQIGYGKDHFQEIVHVHEVDGKLSYITRQKLKEVISACYEMIFKMIRQYMVEEMLIYEAPLHYVLVGGGSEVKGISEFAKQILGEEVVVGLPSMVGVRHAKYTKLIGMAILAHEMALLTNRKNDIIDVDQYIKVKERPKEENEKGWYQGLEKRADRDQSYMDYKLENSGVLVRLFDMIFNDKTEEK